MLNKKVISMVLLVAVALMLMSGCSFEVESTVPVETEPVETIIDHVNPTPRPDPETIRGIMLAPYMPLYGTLNRNDVVRVVGELNEDYYYIAYGENFLGDGVITIAEKQFIKTDGAATVARTVYALENAAVYETAYCNTDAITIPRNCELSVIDEFHGMFYISWTDESGEHFGFISNACITEDAPKNVTPNQSNQTGAITGDSGSNGDVSVGGGSAPSGGDSGSSGGSGSEPQPEYGNEGEGVYVEDLLKNEVSYGNHFGLELLSAVGMAELIYADEAPFEEVTGYAFTDSIPVYVFDLEVGASVDVLVEQSESETEFTVNEVVIAEDGSVHTEEKTVGAVQVYVNGCICEVPECFVSTDEYAAWNGFALPDAMAYAMYDLSDDGIALEVNETVNVSGTVLGVLIVTTKDGDTYYMTPNCVSETEYVAPVATPAPATPNGNTGNGSTGNYGGGTSGGSIDIGGGSSSSGSSDVTPPSGGDTGGSSGGDAGGSSGGDTGGDDGGWTPPVL